MEQVELIAQPRAVGTGAARAVRREGFVPCVLYGRHKMPLSLKVPAKDLQRLVSSSGTHIAKLKVAEGDVRNIVIKEVQVHPVKRIPVHVDFMEISMTDTLKVSIPIAIVGEDEVVKSGLVAQAILREVEAECLPNAIPERLTVDVSRLEAGAHVRAGDLEMPEGVTLLTHGDETIVTISSLKAAAEGAAEEEAEGDATVAAEGQEGAAE